MSNTDDLTLRSPRFWKYIKQGVDKGDVDVDTDRVHLRVTDRHLVYLLPSLAETLRSRVVSRHSAYVHTFFTMVVIPWLFTHGSPKGRLGFRINPGGLTAPKGNEGRRVAP